MSIKLKGIKDAVTLNNNSTAKLTASDIGKPVAFANGKEVALCADGDVIDGILVAVDQTTDFVTVETTGFFELSAPSAVTVPGYVVAAASNGVKSSSGATNARAVSYDSTTGKCWIRLN